MVCLSPTLYTYTHTDKLQKCVHTAIVQSSKSDNSDQYLSLAGLPVRSNFIEQLQGNNWCIINILKLLSV